MWPGHALSRRRENVRSEMFEAEIEVMFESFMQEDVLAWCNCVTINSLFGAFVAGWEESEGVRSEDEPL